MPLSTRRQPRLPKALATFAARRRSTEPASVAVADDIRGLILAGKLEPGEWLGTQPELCERFGVSRGTLREALGMLTSQGLINVTRGVFGGTQVAYLSQRAVSEQLSLGLATLTHSGGFSALETLQARECVELYVVRLLALGHTPEQLKALRATLPGSLDRISWKELDGRARAFHVGMLEACGNRLLQLLAEPLVTQSYSRRAAATLEKLVRERANRDYWQHVFADHAAILNAVETRDADAAAKRVSEHIIFVKPAFLSADERLAQVE